MLVTYSEVNLLGKVWYRVGLKPYTPHVAVSTTINPIRLGEQEENLDNGHPVLVCGILGMLTSGLSLMGMTLACHLKFEQRWVSIKSRKDSCAGACRVAVNTCVYKRTSF